MEAGDTLYITIGSNPVEAIEFIVMVVRARGSGGNFFDCRCSRCGQRTCFEFDSNELTIPRGNAFTVNLNDINSNIVRQQVVGHNSRCWVRIRTLGQITYPAHATVSYTSATGTTSTGPGQHRPGPVGSRSAYGRWLKNQEVNLKRKKKIKLPEYRLIRDD